MENEAGLTRTERALIDAFSARATSPEDVILLFGEGLLTLTPEGVRQRVAAEDKLRAANRP